MKISFFKHFKKIFPYILIIIGAYYISTNFYQFALINGNSMLPTYHSMQIVILDKTGQKYDRGDTIAFYSRELDTILFKRLIGLPGDTIQILDNILYINEIPYSDYDSLNIPELKYNEIVYSGIAKNKITLKSDSYFVLGDNLSESKDSRYPNIGCVNSENIIGKVITLSDH